MQCLRCGTTVPDGSKHCPHCGNPLAVYTNRFNPSGMPDGYQPPNNYSAPNRYNAPYGYGMPNSSKMPDQETKPVAVKNACQRFVKSPLIMIAIIAYTIYTVILTVQLFPMVEHLGVILEAFGEIPGLSMAYIALAFIYVPAIIITVGLWKMFTNNGLDGAETVRGGITGMITMQVIAVGGILLQLLVIAGNLGASLEDMEFGDLLMPIAYFVFSLIAVGAMRGFAESVEYTAIYEKANIDGVMSAGIMILVMAALELFFYLDAMKELSRFSVTGAGEMLGIGLDKDMLQFSGLMYIVALALFGIGALQFHSSITQAYEEDTYIRQQQKIAKESNTAAERIKPRVATVYNPVTQPLPNVNTGEEETIALLKKYKELQDSGVITQEEYEQKKAQLLNKN